MGNDENNFRSSDAFFDGVNFIRTPKSSKKQAPKQPIQNERSEDQEEIASEVMDKYHKKAEKKEKKQKVAKQKRVKQAKVKKKNRNLKLIPIVGALLLASAVLGIGTGHVSKYHGFNTKATPVMAYDDRINNMTDDPQVKQEIAQKVATTGISNNGTETDITALSLEQKIENEIVDEEENHVAKTVAETLKSNNGEIVVHLHKTISTSSGKTVCDKHIYFDSKGDVITAYQYDYDKKGVPTFSTTVQYDLNMVAYAKKVATTAGKDMALDAINLSLLASEDTLPEEFKDELGKNNVGVTIKNEPNFKSEAGASIVGGSEKTLETSASYDIIVNDGKTKDPVFLGGTTVSFDLNGFTHADFYISTNPFNNKGFNVNAGLSADQNGGVQFSVGGAYNTAGQATLNKPTYINYQVNNL